VKPSPTLTSAARWTLLVAAGLVTLVALGFVVENWRGDRAWRACEAALTARGESLAPSAFATPEVPDDRNFLRAPVLVAIAHTSENKPPARKILADARLGAISAAMVGDYKDFAVTRRLFVANGLLHGPATGEPAAEILAALAPAAPLLDSIREADRERPETWLPLKDLTQGRTLEAGTLFNIGKLLAFRAYLEVTLGRDAEAFGDLQATLRLAAAMNTGQRTVLQALVGESLHTLISPALEEGCRRHRWSDAQLADLQGRLARHNSIEALHGALRVERAWGIAYLDRLDDPAMRSVTPWWAFRGWAQQNKVAMFRFLDAALATLDPREDRVLLDQIGTLKARADEMKSSQGPYTYFARMFAGKLDSLIQNFGENANRTTRLLAVIALERHWLAHRDYPATLADLAPGRRPLRDALDGQPLGYTRLSAENYALVHLNADGQTRTTWTLRPPR
jgi:hypothetical protein